MLKKLQNLLFEDEVDEDEDADEEIEDEEVKPAKHHRQAVKEAEARPAAKPVEERRAESKPAVTMQRIDVTRPIPTMKSTADSGESVFRKPAVQTAPVTENRSAPVEKPHAFGIDADSDATEKKQAAPAVKAAAPKKKAPAKKGKNTSVYEFRPVISPMFGVDEKDMDAMQTTARTANNSLHDDNVSDIISPIYGVNHDAQPTSIQTTVERSNEIEHMSVNTEARKAEDAIPEFSLDDILNARDEEFAEQTAQIKAQTSAGKEAAHDVDETVVIDSRHLAPFGNAADTEKKNG